MSVSCLAEGCCHGHCNFHLTISQNVLHHSYFTLITSTQVGYAYVDLRKLPFDQQISAWFPIHVIKKLRYRMCKPQLHLQLYKASQTIYAAVPALEMLDSKQQACEGSTNVLNEKLCQRQEVDVCTNLSSVALGSPAVVRF